MDKKKQKRQLKNIDKGAIIFSCFFAFGVAFTFFFIYVWSNNKTFIGVMNALQVTGILLFIIYFFMILSNSNVFSIFAFGIKKFWSRLIKGKNDNMPRDLFEYNQQKKKAPFFVYFSIYLSSLCFLLPGLIMLIVWGVRGY